MPRLLTPPDLDWQPDGTPVARAHGDVYFAAGEGLNETRAVFLAGCGMPEAWAGREAFTVAETGFGTGLNFLSLWQLWRAHRPHPNARLHFVSFEGFPLRREDAVRALSQWPELAVFNARLLDVWPDPVAGVRAFHFAEDNLTLTLHLGSIATTLPRAQFTADAWFLDGFSPAKNADMWTHDVFDAIAARSAPGARAATFTVAGAVRRGLTEAGFETTKHSGHGRKRERLEAQLASPRAASPDVYGLRSSGMSAARVAIIGAGVAGACLARALADAHVKVTVFEKADAPASGASGNPLALLMPGLDAGESVAGRVLIEAYQSARRFFQGRPGVTELSVVQTPKDATEAQRFEKLLADPPLPLDDLEALSGGRFLHKRALALAPQTLIASLLDGLDVRCGAAPEIDLATRRVNADAFDAIIFANTIDATTLMPFAGLVARLGQVEFFHSAQDAPPGALAQGDYALNVGRVRLWGASFEPAGEGPPQISDAARARNDAALAVLSPWWLYEARAASITSRAGLRATTPDRLPLIGALPNAARAREVFARVRHGEPAHDDAPLIDGIYVATGFGARGFSFAPWAASLLTAQLIGAPAPAAEDVRAAVSPMRFILRALKRGQ